MIHEREMLVTMVMERRQDSQKWVGGGEKEGKDLRELQMGTMSRFLA